MTPTTELFDLIKKMSPSEKRHFKLNSQSDLKEKKYMILFEAVEAMPIYDEKLLKKKLVEGKFSTANLAVAKVNLTKLILKSLRSFSEKNSPEQLLLSKLMEADILKKKGLYAQAIKLLEKNKATAQFYGMHHYVFAILDRLLFFNINLFSKGSDRKIKLILEEIEHHKNVLNKEIELRILKEKALLLFITKSLRQSETISTLEALECHELLKSINNEDTFFAKLYFFFTHACIKHAKRDFEAANPIYLKILELWDRHPHLRELHPRLFKSDITNYLNSCLTLGDFSNNFDTWLERFISIEDNNFDEEAGSFKDYYHIFLLYLLNTRKFERALDLIPNIEKGLKLYKLRINEARENVMRFNVFTALFINEKFSEALDWLNTMSLGNKFDSKADIQALARIMQVIVHYELGHAQIIDYMRTSVYRNLKRQEQLHEFERTILEHIRQLEQVTDKRAKQSLFQLLLDKLVLIGDTQGWSKITGLEEIAAWAESRLINKPYALVLSEKKRT